MAPGRPLTREKDKPRTLRPLLPRSVHIVPVALAFLLVISGLLIFAQAQTQPLFQDMKDGTKSIQSPRDDGGILIGSLFTIAGTTLLLSTLSPLPPSRRVLPAGVFAITGTLLMSAHFSIFTNGIAFPERGIFSVRSTYLFHDTAATIPIATFALAFATLLGLLIAVLAAIALLAPRLLTQDLLRPRTLDGQRTRLLIITLLLLGAGSAFVRQFIAFAFDAAISLETRAMAMAYLLMGALLTLLIVSVTWRTSRLLWGKVEDRMTGRSGHKHERTLRLETGIWTMVMVFTGITLLGDPVWEPSAGTDPVFAMNSVGVSWIFLAVPGIYLIHRILTRAYKDRLHASPRPLPWMGPDRLLALGLFCVSAWSLGVFWSLPTDQSPLVALTLRLLPLVLVLPFFALRQDTTGSGMPSGEPQALLLLSWTVLSILTGIMLWGIGNSVDIRFNTFNGGLVNPGGSLFEGLSAAARLLGSLLIVVPVLLSLHFLAQRNGRSHPSASSLLAGMIAIFTLHVLFTITPAMRHDPFTGQSVVLVAAWSNSLTTSTDITIIGTFVALTSVMGLIITTRLLHRSAEPVPYRLPTQDWLHNIGTKIRRSSAVRRRSAIRQREQKARHTTKAYIVHEE